MPKRFLLFIGFVLVYSAFLTRTYYWDGVLFSLHIEKVHQAELPPSILFHPNHLLYSGFGYLLYWFAQNCGLHVRAITLLQFANVLAGAGAVVFIFALMKRLSRSYLPAVFCCLLFGFGATWWKFATDADSYILSVLLVLLAVGFMISDKRSLLLAGACHSVAMLFHELSIFAYVPILAAVLFEKGSRSARLRHACSYLLGTAGCVVLVYWLAYLLAGRNSTRTFLGWITSFSATSQMTHSWRQILIGYSGSYLKLLAGGKLNLIRDYLSLPVMGALLFSGAFLAAGVWLMRHPERKDGVLIEGETKAVLWAWILPYFLFLAWWEPTNAFYKLFIWPPIVLLLGCAIAEHSFWLSRIKALTAFSAALAVWNFGAFIFPHSHSSADPVLQLAETIHRELPGNATVYYKVLSPDDWYLQYFAPGRRWLPLSTNSFMQPTPEPVCVETTALANLGQNFTINIDPQRRWELVNSKHNVRLVCVKQRE